MDEAGRDDRGQDQAGGGERKLNIIQLRNAARIAAQGLRLGKSPAEINARLRQMGLTRREAEGIEDHARVAYQHSQMRIGTMLMVSAVLWVIGAILMRAVLTGPNVGTYSWVILAAAVLQWLYGWQRRRHARRLRPMKGDQTDPPRDPAV